MSSLDELRQKIDQVDSKLVELFEERLDLVEKIAKYKEEKGLPIFDSCREKQVLEKTLSRLKNKTRAKQIEEFFKNLMLISRNYQAEKIFSQEIKMKIEFDHNKKNSSQQRLRVCFQGLSGSFSEQALHEYFGSEVEKVCVPQFEDVFKELENGSVDRGVLPLENSSTGSVSEIYDLLRRYDFFICGEKIIDVQHNLLGIKGAKLSEIKQVYSHPQAFLQSSEFFKSHPEMELIPCHNTAAGAEYVKNICRPDRAAVASKRAAEIFQLDLIAENINYNKNNKTRFIMISTEQKLNPRNNKVSIVFALEHNVGSLYNALKYFAENSLNLVKIESRPRLEQPWQYFFYLDFEGNLEEKRVKDAIRLIENNSFYFKLLGNYERSS